MIYIYFFPDSNWPCLDSLGDSYNLTMLHMFDCQMLDHIVTTVFSSLHTHIEYKQCSLHWNHVITDILSPPFSQCIVVGYYEWYY